MKTIITPQLLGFLIDHGYTYCYSHTEIIEADHSRVITLTPLKRKPDLEQTHQEPAGHNKIASQPVQMRCNMDHTTVFLNLDFQLDQRTYLMISAYGVAIN